MSTVLVADDDRSFRFRLTQLLRSQGYEVVPVDSVSELVDAVLRNLAPVVIVGARVDGLGATDVVPVLRRCRSDLKVILASEGSPLSVMRKLQREGIFYYLLKPLGMEDGEEVCQVVQCAFENLRMLARQAPSRV